MKKNLNVDIEMWSNDSDIDIYDYNLEDDVNSLTITATVKVYLEFGEWVSFDLDFDIDDLDDIEDGEIYDLSKFGYISYIYKDSSLNPEDEDDVFTILAIAADSCSLGDNLDGNLTQLVENIHNIWPNDREFEKLFSNIFNINDKELDIDEIVTKLEEAGVSDTIDNNFIESLEDAGFDKDAIQKIKKYLCEFVKSNFKPHAGDGLSDFIEDSIQVKFDIH